MSDDRRAGIAIVVLVTTVLVVLFMFGDRGVRPPARECTAIGNAIPINCKPAKGFER